MSSKLDIPLHGHSVSIVRQCGPALSDVLQSKFGCVAIIDGVDFEADLSIAQQKRPTVVPEKRSEYTLAAGVKVSVWKADLTSFPVDAVVNAANDHLQHYGGLALSLSKAGGPQIQKDSDDFIKMFGTLNTGDAAIMDPGSLPCKKIIHAVGPQLSKHPHHSEVSSAERHLNRVIRNILEIVKENRLQSVAIPAISSGLFNYPLPQCADIIVKSVKFYYENYSGYHPKEVMLVNNDEPTVKEMERACGQILSHGSPMLYSQAAAGKRRSDAKASTHTVQMGNVHLTLKKGLIQDQKTDVIVNTTWNRHLNSGEISRAILHRAGPRLQQEMDKVVMKGLVIVTKSYNLQCKEVYHTICTDKERLFKSMRECLWMAASSHHKSIAFPAIGTGGLGFKKTEVVQIMSSALINFAQTSTVKMEVHVVIFPSDGETFKAFEEEIRHLQQMASDGSFRHVLELQDDFQGHRAPTPQICLTGPSNVATREAERWLYNLLFECSGTVLIHNNFILHFGEEEHLQLSRLMKNGISIVEFFERGHASIAVDGQSNEDVAVAGLQVEAMLCNTQREFVKEEEHAMSLMVAVDVSSERKEVQDNSSEFKDRLSAFKHTGLYVVKVDKVMNATLEMLFDLKKKQLDCSRSQKMFQRIPAQFCDMVSRIGFHAEYAPPDDPAYGEGIYFASTVESAKEVWKEPSLEYLHFVEAEVLTGKSCPGKPGLILPPAVGADSQVLYDSVSGPNISVIFSGYQALPKYIITCKIRDV
nr:protein mono-ADP-ribosyltransferase PARP9 isoform X2 [Scatophagus argus]XP_046259479.1 protein mono-ADP-ribosyltransferase PARP9 isoform X2 [Scatophagus argus]